MASRFRRILVPVKGYSSDADAIGLACMLAKRDRGQVFAIYVIEVKRSLPIDVEVDEELQRGEQVLQQADEAAKRSEYTVGTELLQAREVGPAIVDEAIEREVDLIIMGTNYKQRFGEFDPGRTMPYVLKHSPCAVWVLRESAPVAAVQR
ncbi:MAG: universal stress protein [Dehalococcoidia bacterium]